MARKIRKRNSRKWRTETVYAVTDLTADHARPDQLATWLRGHWSIEDVLDPLADPGGAAAGEALESAGIKLSSVATDITEVSRRLMLQALIDSHGTADPAVVADMAKRRMRSKIPLLTEALNGRFTALADPSGGLVKCWQAKELLCNLLTLACTGGPDRSLIWQRLADFHTHCADSGIAQLRRPVWTVNAWQPSVIEGLITGISRPHRGLQQDRQTRRKDRVRVQEHHQPETPDTLRLHPRITPGANQNSQSQLSPKTRHAKLARAWVDAVSALT